MKALDRLATHRPQDNVRGPCGSIFFRVQRLTPPAQLIGSGGVKRQRSAAAPCRVKRETVDFATAIRVWPLSLRTNQRDIEFERVLRCIGCLQHVVAVRVGSRRHRLFMQRQIRPRGGSLARRLPDRRGRTGSTCITSIA